MAFVAVRRALCRPRAGPDERRPAGGSLLPACCCLLAACCSWLRLTASARVCSRLLASARVCSRLRRRPRVPSCSAPSRQAACRGRAPPSLKPPRLRCRLPSRRASSRWPTPGSQWPRCAPSPPTTSRPTPSARSPPSPSCTACRGPPTFLQSTCCRQGRPCCAGSSTRAPSLRFETFPTLTTFGGAAARGACPSSRSRSTTRTGALSLYVAFPPHRPLALLILPWPSSSSLSHGPHPCPSALALDAHRLRSVTQSSRWFFLIASDCF